MLFKARVVACHPESHAVDIVILDDGRRFSGVQVLSPMAGGNVGLVDLPSPSVTDPLKPFESANTGVRDIFCLVDFVSRDIPVVLGFLYPQVSECLFADANLRVNRHASDVYHTITETGDIELSHPSGSFIKISEDPAHVDLTGLDYDARWKIKNNLERLPNIRVVVANINGVQATITIDLAGNVSLVNAGNVGINTAGTTTVVSGGEVSLTAPNVVIDATVHIKKLVTCDDDVVASGKSLVHHTHSDPQGSNTGQPV